jgi:hypothetical protein
MQKWFASTAGFTIDFYVHNKAKKHAQTSISAADTSMTRKWFASIADFTIDF